MLLVIVIAIVALAPVVNDNLFEGYGIVTLALLIAMGTYAPLHMARGICSGSGRFGSYGVIIGMDGAIRVIGCAVLWLSGVDNVGPYALTIAFSPIIGVLLVAATGRLATSDGPSATWGEVTPNLGWLLLGSLFAAALVNAGPITVDLLGDTAPAEVVTRFGNAVIFARIPLFLFQAVQAALLPRLARLAAQRELADFRLGLRKLMYLVVAVGVVGVVGAFLVGPATLELVYEGGIDRRTLTLLAFASALYMAALAIAQAVIALHGHATVAIGWLSGFVTFVLVAWLSSDDLYLRVELALVASSLAALLVFGWSIKNRLARGNRPDDESVIEAFAERPLE
jgi:O-antigen/teichoic acid export membrane protein